MSDFNSVSYSEFGWSIDIFTKDNNGNYIKSPDYLRSTDQTISSNQMAGSGWEFGKSQEYRFNDTFRFVHAQNSQDNDLTKYSILVYPKNGVPANMMLQVGNAHLMGVEVKDTNGSVIAFAFDLSSTGLYENNGELQTSSVKSYLESGNEKGVRTFTIQPLWKTDNNMGQESIVISFGPQFYDSSFKKVYTSVTSRGTGLQSKEYLEGNGFDSFKVGDTTYQVKVGAIADYMLNQTELDDLNIVVNGRNNSFVKANDVILSQNIIYRPAIGASANNDDWKMFTLGFDHKIAVTGQEQNAENKDYMSNGALISGSYSNQDSSSNDFDKFFGGLLDIYSTYESKNSNDYSAEISGITFQDPPSRGMGAVTANGYYPAVEEDYWSTYPNEQGHVTYWSRLGAAIQSAQANENIFDPKNGAVNTRIKIWDNQILSWNTASDGIESLSPNLLSAKNFYKVNDDALKLLSRNQKFEENTIHLGPDGAAISFGYGFNNGPVMNTSVVGAYIHRIVQPTTTPDSTYAGVVADWTYWNKHLLDDPNNPKNAGIITPELLDIYIPSMTNSNQINANVMSRSGTVSAVVHVDKNRQYFEKAYSGQLDNWYKKDQTYKAGGYTIGWENNLRAADFYYAVPYFIDSGTFNMDPDLNQFIERSEFKEKTYTLVMNQDHPSMNAEDNVYQYVEVSPINIQNSDKDPESLIGSYSGVSLFNLAGEESNIVLSNSIGSSSRVFELLGGNQTKKILNLNASNLSEVKIDLSQASNYRTIMAAAPSILNLELSGMYLDSGADNDELTGSQFNDFLRGGDGDDVIFAGSGDDICRVGAGNDILNLGEGNDILFLTVDQLGQQNVNQIQDFNLKEDRILIDHELAEIIEITYLNNGFSVELFSPWATGLTSFLFDSDISGIDIGFG